MANIDWYVEGVEFSNCNCDFSCPCQFEALPTHGNCHGFEAVRIDKGHFGKVPLAGLNIAMLYAWPGPVFEGNGAIQAIIDERATSEQRHALATVLYGGETDEAKTHWWVFHAMSSTVHEPLYKPITFDVDIEARRARVVIPGLLEATGEPIKSPVSGQEHRVRIDIPNGIEFELAEIGSGATRCSGPIHLDLNGTYGQFNILKHSGAGVVHDR
jgi:hypothetical protein